MPASGPPGKNIPMPTGSMEDMSSRLKALKKEAREADREMEKTARKGGDLSKELIEKSRKANAAVVQQESAIKKIEGLRERGARRLERDRESRSNPYEAIGRLREGADRIDHIAGAVRHFSKAFDDENGFKTAGDLLEGAGTLVPGPVGMGLKIAGKGLNVAGDVVEAGDLRKKGLADDRAALAKSGLGGTMSADALREKFQREAYGGNGPGLHLNGNVALSPEVEKAIDEKVKSAIDKAQSLKKSGYDKLALGDFGGARADFKAANREVGGAVAAWYDPGAMWDEEQARGKMRANQAIERMGIRTVPGRDD